MRWSKTVALLKWLARPRITWPMISMSSSTISPTMTAEVRRTRRGALVVNDASHAQVNA
jgi:hypothetical protein